MMLTAALAAAAMLVPVDATLLEGLPTTSVEINDHGTQRTCTGPTLTQVLGRLDVPQGDKLRGEELQRDMLVQARDGYAVLFSLGEIDPAFGNLGAIIASECDGRALDDHEGPYRLVVPGDGKMARSVRQVVTLEIN